MKNVIEFLCFIFYPIAMLIYFIFEGSTPNPPSFSEFWGYAE